MANNSFIEIPPCPQCGHTWRENLKELQALDQEFYKGDSATRECRVRCPKCGTQSIITVAVPEGKNG